MSELEVERADGVLRLTINAPEQLNAVDTALVHALADEIMRADNVRVAVISGAGTAFCSGARLSDGGPTPGFLDAASRLIQAITTAPYPVVAAVHGPAAGIGCSVALASDIVIASERAYFLQAFVRVGLMPDGGATELLAASIGRSQAMWLAMSGERLTATDALQRGLIAQCLPEEGFSNAVEQVVTRLAAGPTNALARTKTAINLASIPHLSRTLELERSSQTTLLGSADYREGVAAFAQKRTAEFRGE
ncbi:enoyl-CoA hydratase-related protein [Microbacterium sp. A84]|uniref:enoyl-CoA hydratase-related protein n=1 Tax=Microbacterium sp. A84 TaxID=3450715 RepID=UPI003F42AC62